MFQIQNHLQRRIYVYFIFNTCAFVFVSQYRELLAAAPVKDQREVRFQVLV